MPLFVATIWNGECFEDSNEITLIIPSSTIEKAKEKAEYLIKTEKNLRELSNNKPNLPWYIIPNRDFKDGKVLSVIPLSEKIQKDKNLIAKALIIEKEYLADRCECRVCLDRFGTREKCQAHIKKHHQEYNKSIMDALIRRLK